MRVLFCTLVISLSLPCVSSEDDAASLFAQARTAAQGGDMETADQLLQKLVPTEHAAEALMKRGNIGGI